mmetsp:Transcript_9990/g.15112  ORF Transcript_9990/g.15112 Transcript_9990/m.15112 type:complete len:229 (+) Transcript_9990:942-1628(+)
METPYTRQTFSKNPGPGHYHNDKKKNGVKDRIVMEETVHCAFASSEERTVNRKVKAPNPGPGSYIDINNPLHCSLKSQPSAWAKEDRAQQEEQGIKIGPFGTVTHRFFRSWLEPREGPDPGQYVKSLVNVSKANKGKLDLAIEGKSNASTRALTAAEKERSKPNSIFLSTTDRFNNLEKSNPTVRILKQDKQRANSDDGGKIQNSLFKNSKNIIKANEKVQYDFKDTR